MEHKRTASIALPPRNTHVKTWTTNINRAMPPRESHHSVEPWSPQPSTRNQPTPKLDTCWNNNSQGDTQGFSPPNQGSVGTREDSVQHRGKGSRLIVTSRKHIARNTIRPATPPRHTPDHAHTCNPGEETKHIRPLTHNPAQNPLNHTQTTNHDQRRWGMLNFLSPNTQAEPSTLQHAKQPGTLY